MLISINGIWLTNDGSGTYTERAVTSAQEVKPGGKQLTQVAQFVRGLTSIPYGRGNKLITISFKVTRNFRLINPSDTNPIATAEAFMLTDFSQRPQSGPLSILCGQIGSSGMILAYSPFATLDAAPSLDTTGVRMETEYMIQCATLTSGPGPGNALTDQIGVDLTDQSGVVLTS